MTDDLATRLEDIRFRIKKDYSLYAQGRGGEKNVVEHLVRPVLLELGWSGTDIQNEPEEYTEDGSRNYPDFVITADNKRVLVIECKKLDSDIGPDSKTLEQLRQYLITFHCSLGITTNGAKWYLWKMHRRRPAEVWSLDLSWQDTESCMNKLMDIRKDSASEMARRIKTRLGSSPRVGALPEILEIDESAESEIASDKEFPVMMWLVIDDERFEIRFVREILTKTAEWLVRKGLFRHEDCPISTSSRSKTDKYLINIEPKHRDGSIFRRGYGISEGLWVESPYGKAGAIRQAKMLLHRFAPEADMRVAD